jgi:hypothetical protein
MIAPEFGWTSYDQLGLEGNELMRSRRFAHVMPEATGDTRESIFVREPAERRRVEALNYDPPL